MKLTQTYSRTLCVSHLPGDTITRQLSCYVNLIAVNIGFFFFFLGGGWKRKSAGRNTVTFFTSVRSLDFSWAA